MQTSPVVKAENPKQEIPKQVPAQQEVSKPQTTVKPVGTFKNIQSNEGFRLKQAQQVVEANNAVSEPKMVINANQSFSVEQLKQSVTEFARTMQDQGKKQIAMTLRAEMIALQNETEVIVEIENRAQIEGFEPVKQSFLDHLRKNLGNQSISLRMQEKAADPTKRAYSPTEKFETMLQKNPALLTLKERLGMELDY